MTEAIDIDALRRWIGREETAEDVVTPELVRRFNATLDRASGDLGSGSVAPPAIHWCLAPPVVPMSRLGRDGHPALGGFLPPVPLPRRMWAGGRVRQIAPIHIGDTVQRQSIIADVTLKQGRTGPLCFVTVEHAFRVAGEPCVLERQDIVYRAAETAPAASPATQPDMPAPQWSQSVDATDVLLFRYSALTFNGHRIHYDRRFCIETEGYPGLIVHGPLQATLLITLATDVRNSIIPRDFAFRSTATLFDGETFTVNATEGPAGLSLWTADASGRPAMRAEATW